MTITGQVSCDHDHPDGLYPLKLISKQFAYEKQSHGSIRSINLPSPSTILNLLPVAFDLASADL